MSNEQQGISDAITDAVAPYFAMAMKESAKRIAELFWAGQIPHGVTIHGPGVFSVNQGPKQVKP